MAERQGVVHEGCVHVSLEEGVMYCVRTGLLYVDPARLLNRIGGTTRLGIMEQLAFSAACFGARQVMPVGSIAGYCWVSPNLKMRGLNGDGKNLDEWLRERKR